MKIKKNGKVITLTESDLNRIVKKQLINEATDSNLENRISRLESQVQQIVKRLNNLKK